MENRLYNIDFMRIFLLCAILVHHFYHAATGRWNTGGNAVEFFFIISGFIFNFTFNSSISFKQFILEKLIRFWPILAFCSLAVALIFHRTDFKLDRLFSDLFMLSKTGLYKGSTDGLGYNGPGWYVCVLFWILLFYFYLKKSISPTLSGLIFALITFSSLEILVMFKIPSSYYLFRGLGSFGIGYFCYEFCKNYSRNRNNKKSYLFSVLETILIIYFAYILFSFNHIKNPIAFQLGMGLFLVLLYLRKGYISSFLERKEFTKLSRYTLATYLTHALIFYQPAIKTIYKEYIKNPYYICILGILVSFVLGIIVYHFFERPIVNYLKRRLSDH